MTHYSGQRVQLHRALSKLGICSRTEAWECIRSGRVLVDGRVVREPLTWIDLARQQITGAQSTPAQQKVTIVLHKPRATVTTRRDERGRRTLYDLLPNDLPYLFPVGRLDADSEGLLLLTNDSALSQHLTDPEHHVPKTYHITLRDLPNDAALRQLREGVALADGPTRPALVRVIDQCPKKTILEVTLTEGRNRQVRRMTAAVGHKTRRLVRVSIGSLQLGDLSAGQWRYLTTGEIDALLNRQTDRERRR